MTEEQLPYLLFQEASTCGAMAMLAIAHVWANGGNFYLLPDSPQTNATAQWIAANFHKLPDPTNGATFAFSLQDIRLERVKTIIRQRGLTLKAQFQCASGLGLEFY